MNPIAAQFYARINVIRLYEAPSLMQPPSLRQLCCVLAIKNDVEMGKAAANRNQISPGLWLHMQIRCRGSYALEIRF